MRSVTSFFDKTVFKKTVLRFWPVWSAYSAVWMILLPLNGLMQLQMDVRDPMWADPGDGYLVRFAEDFVPGMCNAVLIFAAAFGVLAAMAVCSHLYNAKSANFFAALPIRREGLFLTHYLAGLSFLLVPNVVVFLLTLLTEAAGGALYLTGLLFWLGAACGECLFFYSMAVFCGMFTGHILALPAFYAIFNALAAVLYYLANWVFDSFYYGYASDYEGWAIRVVTWLTPVLKLGRGVRANYYVYDDAAGMSVRSGPDGLQFVAVYAAAAVVLAACSFLLYRARRLESAGDVVAILCMRPVFKYCVAVCAGLCFGMLTAQAINMHEPGLMASMLVWAVIGYFVAQMLLDKSFRVFHKWKGATVVAGVFVLMFLVVGFDMTGYETRVPAADQVSYVNFGGGSVHHLGDGGDYVRVVRDDPEFIKLAVILHQEAVDQRDMKDASGREYSQLSLTYHLKNGSILSRRYSLWVDTTQKDQEGTAAWAIQQMYGDRDLYWEAYDFDEADRRVAEEGYRLDEVTLSNHGRRYGPDEYYYGKDAQALYEAVKEDFLAGRIGVRTVGGENYSEDEAYQYLEFQFSAPTKDRDGYVAAYVYVSIRVQDTASSTLAVLDRLAQED